MTFQPYPTGSGSNQMPGPVQRPPQPASLRNAVRLMWAGAALALIGVIITLAFSSKIRSAVNKAAVKANATRRGEGKSVLTASQIHSLASVTIVLLAVVGIIAVLLWVWMAWANNRGSSWARIVATVLFGLNTISFFLEVGRASITIIAIAVGWLIGLVAIVLLWRKETSAYIKPQMQ
jgi:H+/Cl- antiporter ClcA